MNKVSYFTHGSSLCKTADANFTNILDVLEDTENNSFEQLLNNSVDIKTNEYFEATFKSRVDARRAIYESIVKPDKKDFVTSYSDALRFFNTNANNHRQSVNEYRRKRNVWKSNPTHNLKPTKTSTACNLIHFNTLDSAENIRINEPTHIMMFDMDNFSIGGSLYLSQNEIEVINKYMLSRPDCIAIVNSVSMAGFHYYLHIDFNVDNFEQVYFSLLHEVTVGCGLKKPIFDVTVGTKMRKDYWGLGIVYRNDNAVKTTVKYNTDINPSRIKNFYWIKSDNQKDITNGLDKVKTFNNLFANIEAYKYMDVNDIAYKIVPFVQYELPTSNASESESIKTLDRISNKINWHYTTDGNNLCMQYINKTFCFNIDENILDSYFANRVGGNKNVMSTYNQIKKSYLNKMSDRRGSIPIGTTKIKKLNVINDDQTERLERLISNKPTEFNVNSLSDTDYTLNKGEFIKPEWIMPHQYLYLKSDTKSGKTFNTVYTRLKQLNNSKQDHKIIVVVPTKNIIQDKFVEFNTHRLFRELEPKIQFVDGSVPINKIDFSNNLFICTAQAYKTKFKYLDTNIIHLIVDELHSYIQQYEIKNDLYDYIENNIVNNEFASVTLLTGTPIESIFFDTLLNKFKTVKIVYGEHIPSTINVKPGTSLNDIMKRIKKDYDKGLNILFYHNSRTVDNPAMKTKLAEMGVDINHISLIDSTPDSATELAHSVVNIREDARILIATSTLEMGVGLKLNIDKVYIKADLNSIISLVSIESLIQLVNRTDRKSKSTKSIIVDIFSYTLANCDGYIDRTIPRQQWVNDKLVKIISNHKQNCLEGVMSTDKQFEIIDYKTLPSLDSDGQYCPLNNKWKSYITYKIEVLYDYLVWSSFNTRFSTAQTKIGGSIDESEYNDLQTGASINSEMSRLRSINEKEINDYFIDRLDGLGSLPKRTDLDEELDNMFEQFELNVKDLDIDPRDYIIKYILKNGYINTVKDLYVCTRFFDYGTKSNLIYLLSMAKNHYCGTLTQILRELNYNKLFKGFNTKDIGSELRKYGVRLKLNRTITETEPTYFVSFEFNEMISHILFMHIDESKLESNPNDVYTKKQIINFSCFDEIREYNLTEKEMWSTILVYCISKNILIKQVNRGKYSINKSLFENADKKTKSELNELVGTEHWVQTESLLKSEGIQFEEKSTTINKNKLRVIKLLTNKNKF